MRSNRGVFVVACALLTAVAATTPAIAKPGGGNTGGSGLDVSVVTDGLMWANSPGDTIPFDITVTNRTGGSLTVTIQFKKGVSAVPLTEQPVVLPTRASWTGAYDYTVDGTIAVAGNTGDFFGAPISEQTSVIAGTVTASVADVVVADADAVMTVYPVLPCPGASADSFTFGPDMQYSECSFTPSLLPADWKLTTTAATPKKGNRPISPSASLRDALPGNWCPEEVDVDGNPTGLFHLIQVCPNGGAGGDEIPVRNTDTFYLDTAKGNTVVATSVGSGG